MTTYIDFVEMMAHVSKYRFSMAVFDMCPAAASESDRWEATRRVMEQERRDRANAIVRLGEKRVKEIEEDPSTSRYPIQWNSFVAKETPNFHEMTIQGLHKMCREKLKGFMSLVEPEGEKWAAYARWEPEPGEGVTVIGPVSDRDVSKALRLVCVEALRIGNT